MSNESIANKASGRQVYEILKNSIRLRDNDFAALIPVLEGDGPFAVLIAVILSQNTNDKNAIKAYYELKKRIGVDPYKLARTDTRVIADAIRIAGLADQKAYAIRKASELIIELGGPNALTTIEPSILEERLLSIKGIGRKTVDVTLSVLGRKSVFAVDTHAFRVARRWGISKGGYERTSQALSEYFRGVPLDEAHRLVIALGRLYCKARNPRCKECPLREICPYPKQLQQASLKEKPG